jgi:hypothetical protein
MGGQEILILCFPKSIPLMQQSGRQQVAGSLTEKWHTFLGYAFGIGSLTWSAIDKSHMQFSATAYVLGVSVILTPHISGG